MKPRFSIPFLLLLAMSIRLPAQVIESGSDYQDLFDLYVFKKYEKCLKKALRYQEQDKRRRDPEPYLFISVCYLQIHDHPENFDPELAKRPLKEALKYAYRFKKRDDLLFLQKLNEDHLNDLRIAGLELGLHYMQLEKYRKASYYLKWTNKVFPDDYATKLVYGMSQVMNRNIYEGRRNIELAYELIETRLQENEKIRLKKDADPVMSAYLKEYIEYWEKRNNTRKTLQTISIAHLLLGDRSEFWAKLN